MYAVCWQPVLMTSRNSNIQVIGQIGLHSLIQISEHTMGKPGVLMSILNIQKSGDLSRAAIGQARTDAEFNFLLGSINNF